MTQPINAAQAFVLAPLSAAAPTDPALAAALATYNAASSAQQLKWATNYGNALAKVTFSNGTPVVPAADDGPVPVLLATELTLARSGAIDADLLAHRSFYGTDFTEPLLFLEDGMYFANQATAMHLTGTQWGVMNETGSYPGQPWLWLYTLWYQIPGFGNSTNADLIAIYLTGLATVLLLAIPFIPGLRDIPRWIPVHRLVWRDWNHRRPAHRAARARAQARARRPEVGRYDRGRERCTGPDRQPRRRGRRRVLHEPGYVGDALRQRPGLRARDARGPGAVRGRRDRRRRRVRADRGPAGRGAAPPGPRPGQRAGQPAQRAPGPHPGGEHRRGPRHRPRPLRRAAPVGHRGPGADGVGVGAHQRHHP